ncbi:MAG: hypothetical protein RL095_16 [Verrucomicrobiota bacterium]|jgi:superfamily II DNA/RNA helicase
MFPSFSAAARSWLENQGISRPTPIQEAAFAAFTEEGDLFLHAPTGTGKTLAFALPLIERLAADPKRRALILSPTPELAMQTLGVLRQLAPDLSNAAIAGGASLPRQKERLKEMPQLICATPGRLFDLLGEAGLRPGSFDLLVFDELDMMVNQPEVCGLLQRILSRFGKEPPRLVAASATRSPRADAFLQETFRQVRVVSVQERFGHTSHHYRFSPENGKDVSLARLLKEQKIGFAFIFVAEARLAPHLDRFLQAQGLPSVHLQAEMPRSQRQQVLAQLRSGAARYLITTDLLARGIDLSQADVIQYDIARTYESYTHRSGRTGRGGAEGRNISLITKEDAQYLRRWSEKLGGPIEELPAHARENSPRDESATPLKPSAPKKPRPPRPRPAAPVTEKAKEPKVQTHRKGRPVNSRLAKEASESSPLPASEAPAEAAAPRWFDAAKKVAKPSKKLRGKNPGKAPPRK